MQHQGWPGSSDLGGGTKGKEDASSGNTYTRDSLFTMWPPKKLESPCAALEGCHRESQKRVRRKLVEVTDPQVTMMVVVVSLVQAYAQTHTAHVRYVQVLNISYTSIRMFKKEAYSEPSICHVKMTT